MRLLMIMAVALFLLAPTAAHSGATYYCYCKGHFQWGPLFDIYTDCGNGSVGGNKGQWVRDLTFQDLLRYMPLVKAKLVRENTYYYDPHSGWACSKNPVVPTPGGGGGL